MSILLDLVASTTMYKSLLMSARPFDHWLPLSVMFVGWDASILGSLLCFASIVNELYIDQGYCLYII